VTPWLQWQSGLPSEWQAVPLRAAADIEVSNVDKFSKDGEAPVRLCNYTDVYNNERITLSLPFMAATATDEEIGRFGLRRDDVVITKDSESWDDIGVPALVAEAAADLVCGYHLAIIRPRPERLCGAFLLRCLQTKPVRLHLELAANGVTRFGIPKSDIGALKIPVPPLAVQRRIAAYLDRESTRIDALVAAKEELLAILDEKRRALITTAVTRGLDPTVPLRDSGAPWLGRIPRHWKAQRVAVHYWQRDERGEPDLPLLEVSINTGVALREFSDERIESTAADFNSYKVARRGDIVFNKMRMWQGAVGVAPQDGLVSPDYTVACPKGGVISEYARLLFRTDLFSAECARNSIGIVWDRMRIYWDGFRDIVLPIPPPAEQAAIAAHINAEAGRIKALRAETENTIFLLKERRGALISAAVTGVHLGG
jgi:type I restriction enzyme S subunit